jgi:polysaccharide export outer membrane protein
MNLLPKICALVALSAATIYAQAPTKGGAPKTAALKTAPQGTERPAGAAAPQTPDPRLRPPPASYHLSPGDTVKLSVFNEPRLSDEGTLSSSGDISFPLIGAVHLSGKSIKDAEKTVAALYYDMEFLVDPRVSLSLTGYAQHTVTVSGAVATPGAITIPQEGRFDVLAAITAAGGAAEKADLRSVILRPASGGANIPCDVVAMQANPALARIMKSGDSLTIPFIPQKVARFVNVMGEVKNPAPVEVTDAGRMDVLTAIARAGGYTRIAKPSKITVIRSGAGGKQTISLDGTAMAKGSVPLFYLLPGDTLTVAESRF